MSNGRLYRTEGIVIARRDQGEADRVLRLCTPDGKVDVLAKGARKIRSRKAGHIELFPRSAFVMARVPNYWDIVSQAETIDPHTELRSDLLRGTFARYAVELLDRFFTEGEGGTAAFDLMNHTLTWLCTYDDLDLVIRFYEQHLLGLAGFRPELFRCVGRHQDQVQLHPDKPGHGRGPLGFSAAGGGALCRQCYATWRQERDVMPLSPNALRLLQTCQRGSVTEVAEQPVSHTLHREMERLMQHYITYQLEQDVKAAAFLQQIRRGYGARHG